VSGQARVMRDGDADRAAAFTGLADAYLDASYRLAHAILGSRAEAEDATHDALVTAWRQWATLRDPGRFEAWFRRILINTCRNRLRQSSRRPTADLSATLRTSGADPIRLADEREQIGDALARLSPDHRTVLALRYYLDLPIEDIAKRLGIAPGTVSSRIHYALRELRVTLQDTTVEGADR
jgi:RNA polymerase sigma-70 factor (ECF subfamily)